MLINNTYRSTTVYKQATDTYRASSVQLFDIFGQNLQNIPDEIRRIYIADDGKDLVQCDQAGAEAKAVAYLCKPGRYRDLFIHNVKPHVYVALIVFLDKWKIKCKDIDIDKFVSTPIGELKDLTGWKELDNLIKESDKWEPSQRYYFIAKMIVHASSYGMRAPTFQLNVLEKSRGIVVLTKQQCEYFLSTFHSLFPEIHDWHRSVDRQIEETKVLFNLQGYPRFFTRPLRDNKEAYAYIPQSTIGCITHIEITNEQAYIETCNRNAPALFIGKLPEPVIYCLDTYGSSSKKGWDVLGNCHDSSLSQAPWDESMTLARVKKYLMEQTLVTPRGESFIMKAEVGIGKNWGKHKDDNLDGMQEVKI